MLENLHPFSESEALYASLLCDSYTLVPDTEPRAQLRAMTEVRQYLEENNFANEQRVFERLRESMDNKRNELMYR